jgi:predicted permease
VRSNFTRTLLGLAAIFVPSAQRVEWMEEWEAELEALEDARRSGAVGLPSRLEFVAGAFPHAMWMRTEGWTMDGVLQDLRYSARRLRTAPGFTLVAALTLALGIGANASIFSLVNGLVLRAPSDVVEPGRLVQIGRSFEDDPKWDSFSWPAMRTIAEEARTLSGVAGYSGEVFVLGSGEDSERALGHLVTGNFFDLLGVQPQLGRLLQPSDDLEPGAHRVVALSHGLWVDRYGADPDIVGKTILIGNEGWEVVGVTPPGFVGIENVGFRPQLFAPVTMHPYIGEDGLGPEWGWSWLNLVGRLEDGVSFEEARASMEIVSDRLREINPVHEGIEVLLAEGVGLDPDARSEARRVSVILAVIVAVVLLLTCTNVANLFLARASGRTAEFGVRMALGAGRGKLVTQLLTETGLLALVAVAMALPLVTLASGLLPHVLPYSLTAPLEVDRRVYAFLLVVGVLAGLLLAIAPAWSAARKDAVVTLREGASTGRRTPTRLRDALVVTQIALSLGLVSGAALLARSVANAHRAEPGFDPAGLSASYMDLYSTGRYDRESGQAFYAAVLREAEQLPNLRGVTLANQLPIVGGQSRSSVQPVGREDVSFEAEYNIVGPRYFETLGIPLLRGRGLGGFDDEPERVVVVNEALASLFWPGEDAVGKELAGDPAWRVVGVAGDVQSRSLRSRANPAVYYPIAHQYMPYSMALVLSTEVEGAATPEVHRSVIRRLDPALPPARVYDLQAALVDSMGETRTIGYLVGSFAFLALALAVIGLYGLVSYGASQRVREFGIRIALGARPRELTRLVLSRGLRISVWGVLVGGAVSYGVGVALQSLLFGVRPSDPATLSGAAVALISAAVVAAWLPARRASRVDASVSLREQ